MNWKDASGIKDFLVGTFIKCEGGEVMLVGDVNSLLGKGDNFVEVPVQFCDDFVEQIESMSLQFGFNVPAKLKFKLTKSNMVEHLTEIGLEVTKSGKSKYIIEGTKFGTIDYFPKSDRLLVRKDNNWFDLGIVWLKENLL